MVSDALRAIPKLKNSHKERKIHNSFENAINAIIKSTSLTQNTKS